ncbi:MAG: ABC transporter substrate-binding protein [Deltaproteobacteria bacterium]|nr:ABC transporter substrate-binding protein [Deltaproteobacteria bacterium]MBW2697512.1 ABC transporter substrate-binding protein [Deltaproteobacteria bacterium]
MAAPVTADVGRGCRHGLRTLFVGAVLMATGTSVLAAHPDPPEDVDAFVVAPRAIVAESVARVIAILNEAGLSSPERRKRIEGIAFDVFDFTTMSKLVLARGWRTFDASQREAFIHEFKIHLSRSYGSRLDRYQQTDVAVVGTRLEPRNDVSVLTRVVGGQYDGVEMNYRLRERGGEWGVIDVVIEGVSLVANFRSQFKEVLSRGGPDELLEQMRKKNATPSGGEDESTGEEAG